MLTQGFSISFGFVVYWVLIYSEFLTHFIFFQSSFLGIVAKGPSLSDGLGESKALFSKECVYFKLVDISELLGNNEDAQREFNITS